MTDRSIVPAAFLNVIGESFMAIMSSSKPWLAIERESDMTEEELIEQLADKEHASWARWQQYFHSECMGLMSFYVHGDDREKAQAITHLLSKFAGAIVIVPELVEGLERQINTPYAGLSEMEKQLDRDEVAHILPIIKEYCKPNSLLDQAAITHTIAKMDEQIRRLNTEVFATDIARGTGDDMEERRITLLGRVNDLCGIAGIAEVDHSFFVD